MYGRLQVSTGRGLRHIMIAPFQRFFFRQRLRINRATINIGKSAVIEAAQDAVGSPYELWDDRIYFLRTLQI